MELSTFVAGFWRLENWGMSYPELAGYIDECIELGVTTMDHAMVYGSEQRFGKALALAPALRDRMQIVTKFGIRPRGFGALGAEVTNHYDSGKPHVIASVEASLKNLNTEYIDLLLVHRPDFLMDVNELSETFEQLRIQGKVRQFGVSNFNVSQFELLQSALDFKLLTNQVEFSPLAMQALTNGLFDQCMQHRMQPMLWSCLGGGELLNAENPKSKKILQALQSVGEKIGAHSVEQVVYAWCLSLPCAPKVMLGSSKIERIRSAVAAGKLSMTREQWYSIWEAGNGAPVP